MVMIDIKKVSVHNGCDIKRFGSTDSDVWLSALPTGTDVHNRYKNVSVHHLRYEHSHLYSICQKLSTLNKFNHCQGTIQGSSVFCHFSLHPRKRNTERLQAMPTKRQVRFHTYSEARHGATCNHWY